VDGRTACHDFPTGDEAEEPLRAWERTYNYDRFSLAFARADADGKAAGAYRDIRPGGFVGEHDYSGHGCVDLPSVYASERPSPELQSSLLSDSRCPAFDSVRTELSDDRDKNSPD
jgi:hypothetical protein